TEIHDYLRLLFARAGVPHCPICDRVIHRQSPREIVDRLLERFAGKRAMLLAPVVRGRKGEYRQQLHDLKTAGLARGRPDGAGQGGRKGEDRRRRQDLTKEAIVVVRLDGEVQTIEQALDANLERFEKHDIDVVIDRIKLDEGDRTRIAESTELALAKGEGLVRVLLPDDGLDELFSEKFACPEHGTFLEELEPRTFSFNSPYGACPHCSGLGYLQQFDPELIVPDDALSIAKGAIAPWTGGRADGGKVFYWDRLRALADHAGFDLQTPWPDLPDSAKELVLRGSEDPIEVVYARGGRETMRFRAEFEGVIPNLERRLKEASTDFARERLEEYMSLVPCQNCHGTRYKPEVLAVRV